MRKLLRSGLKRLWMDKLFWFGIAALIGFGVYMCYDQHRLTTLHGTAGYLDTPFFAPQLVLNIIMAAFVSLFVGREYSDGTMRNKLVVGSSRTHVYLANFVTCAIASLIIRIAAMAMVLLIGFPLVGTFKMPLDTIFLYVGVDLLLTVSFSAIYVFVAMTVQNKTITAIINLCIIFLGLLLAAVIKGGLDQPEFIHNLVLSMNGETTTSAYGGEPIPNPEFLTGQIRIIYQWILDILPTGQCAQLTSGTIQTPFRLMLCSVASIALFNGIGAFIFNKQDLK